MAYITEVDVSELLGEFDIPASWKTNFGSGTELTGLEKAIARAKESIDRATGAIFETVQRSFILNGNDTIYLSLLPMTKLPIVSVQEIMQRDSLGDSFDVDGTLIESDTYYVDDSRRFIIRPIGDWHSSGGWKRGHQNFRVRATIGKDGVPEIVKKAAVLLVREEIQPGYIQAFEQMSSESFADGYSYARNDARHTPVNAALHTTGHAYVDALLVPLCTRIPGMACL